MRLVRNLTAVTANLGRKATTEQFLANVNRLEEKFDLKTTYFGFQEIDEDDRDEEMDHLRKVFGDTHRFVGVHTHVPIAVPKTFGISTVDIAEASDGVKGLQPDRHVVDVVVFPDGLKTKRKIRLLNTHVGRDIPELKKARADSFKVLDEHYDNDRPTIVTLDANSEQLKPLQPFELKLASGRVDYIRAVERRGVRIRLLNRGTVRLDGDGHNAEFANLQIIWP